MRPSSFALSRSTASPAQLLVERDERRARTSRPRVGAETTLSPASSIFTWSAVSGEPGHPLRQRSRRPRATPAGTWTSAPRACRARRAMRAVELVPGRRCPGRRARTCGSPRPAGRSPGREVRGDVVDPDRLRAAAVPGAEHRHDRRVAAPGARTSGRIAAALAEARSSAGRSRARARSPASVRSICHFAPSVRHRGPSSASLVPSALISTTRCDARLARGGERRSAKPSTITRSEVGRRCRG